MHKYSSLKDQHQLIYTKLKKQFSLIAVFRFFLGLLIFISIWQFIKHQDALYIGSSILLLVAFIVILNWHQNVKYKRNIAKKLVEINTNELAYLNNNEIPFDDGSAFIDANHLYTYDLDIFGPKSLFHHLNRTATPIGNNTLANKLSIAIDSKNIEPHQIAIQELTKKVDFRQLINATAKLAELDEAGYNKLIEWSKQEVEMPNKAVTILRFFIPVLFFLMIVLSVITSNVLYTYLANTFFLINLSLFALQLKQIKKELIATDKIHETLNQYALIFNLIIKEDMQAAYLVNLKDRLSFEGVNAYQEFHKLSKLFNNLSSMQNPIGAIFFNGALLYHLGVYKELLFWKKSKAKQIEKYLEILGEFEALNALANFWHNNPTFVFPKINHQFQINFKACGHPLIHSSKRICNNVNFNEGSFMILTGSNMSGKSTFLRTLGINMILTNAGAPVCAREANVHPLQVIVSMRMSDSLSDSESYFFAEVKRLKQIMNELDEKKCFVLLDEILKGTNSDDKRLGTIKVVEKMVQKKAIGAIATHDLEVCNITTTYPNNLSNNCFEVEIINNELVFDYQLREGICKNKSATFLMNKMEII